MIRLLASTLFFAAAICAVNEAWWQNFRPNLKKIYQRRLENELAALKEALKNRNQLPGQKQPTLPPNFDQILDDLVEMTRSHLEAEELADYEFASHLGSGSYGVVFKGVHKTDQTMEPIAYKVTFEKNAECFYGKTAFDNYKNLRDHEIPCLVRIDNFKCMTKQKLTLSGTQMEAAVSSRIEMFAKMDTEDERRLNTLKFLDFALSLLKAFWLIHRDAESYHFDVKPDNIMWKEVGESIEARVIDFDLSSPRGSEGRLPEHPVYSPEYRPPELKGITTDNNLTEEQTKKWNDYRLTETFKEETWALGKALSKIMLINNRFLLSAGREINGLIRIINSMTVADIDLRTTTEQAYRDLLEIVTKIKKKNKKII